jgi:hypothetical protein
LIVFLNINLLSKKWSQFIEKFDFLHNSRTDRAQVFYEKCVAKGGLWAGTSCQPVWQGTSLTSPASSPDGQAGGLSQPLKLSKKWFMG